MKLKLLLAALAMSVSGVVASAQLITFSSRTAFNAQGTIAYNSNFADFGGSFGFPANPFTRGDITYASSQNITVGSETWYSIGDAQTVITNNYWTPILGTINPTPRYDLFGFDAAVTSGTVNITIGTNLGTYHFNGLTLPNGSPTFAFEGFRAIGSGEYFTSFRIDSQGSSYLPGMTNVAVGIASSSPVPEPSTYGLFGALALVGLGLVRRLRGQRTA